MPRPSDKQALLHASDSTFEALHALVDELSPKERNREFAAGTMNRNIRDVLGHLHHWHRLLLDWYAVGMRGDRPDMPATGYTWKQTSALNRAIHAMYARTPLRRLRLQLRRSHAAVHALIVRHSNRELFTKRQFVWVGSTSLGAYLTSATCSHYEWALRLIRRGLR
jgi:hypothetical protein